MGSPGSNALATATRVGLSQPISTGGPTESDIAKTRELEKVGCLHSSAFFKNYSAVFLLRRPLPLHRDC